MPALPPGNAETISYPIEHIRSVASTLWNDASNALEHHQSLWNRVQEYLNHLGPENADAKAALLAVLEPHEQRMRASFTWQKALAITLTEVASVAETTDQNIGQGLTPKTHGPF